MSGDGFTINDSPDDAEPDGKAGRRRRPRARDLLPGFLESVELWCDRRGAAFATIDVAGHRENHSVTSRGFRAWLTMQVYRETGAALSASGLADALRLAEARALAEGRQHETFRRWGLFAGKIYCDLGGPDWRAVEIDPAGWRIARGAPCKFVRPPDCLPLPEPAAGAAQWGDLRRFLNFATDDACILNWAWLLDAARAFAEGGAYPLLSFHGPQGAGKTVAARRNVALIDPAESALRALPREERDLIVAAAHRHLLCFDNVSGLGAAWSDALCRLATGGAFGARTLHSDDQETIFAARRPVILTGIPNTIGRPDLAERAISIELAPLAGERATDAALDAAFADALPGLLGLLMDGISSAQRCYDSTHVENLPRMADACRWAEAGAIGLGIEPGRIADAWRANRAGADADVVESDEVAGAVRALLAAWSEPTVKKSPAELARLLAEQVPERTIKSPFWPKTASAMGTHLRRIAPALRVAWGIAITSGKGGADSSRWWELRRL
jgi:hypothetical protein